MPFDYHKLLRAYMQNVKDEESVTYVSELGYWSHGMRDQQRNYENQRYNLTKEEYEELQRIEKEELIG